MKEAMKRIKAHGHEQVGVYVDDDDEGTKTWYKNRGESYR